MKVHRAFLYSGLFLVALGGVLVAADLGAADTATLTDTARLWPLVPIALGAGLVLRRTRASLATGLLAAAVPGLVLGGVVAAAPRFGGDCGARGELRSVVDRGGTFDGPATVSVSAGCGTLTVRTNADGSWQFTAGNTAGRAPAIAASARSLSIDESPDHGYDLFGAGRDSWDLALPTSALDALSITTFANKTRMDLAGAHVGSLAVTANASDIVVDASGASVGQLSAAVNVGSLSLRLPAVGNVTGSLRVGGGDLEVCVPDGVGLKVTSRGLPRQVSVEGLAQNGSDWQSANYATAASHADITVSVNFGNVDINPIGGCR